MPRNRASVRTHPARTAAQPAGATQDATSARADTFRAMADIHDEKVNAAIWAMLRQNLGPSAIIRALAADECGIGYPVDLKRSTFYDRKRKLIRQFGEPAAVVERGEEDDAADAIRREALGALKLTARTLKAKAPAITKAEAGTLDVCLKAIDGHERRRRDGAIDRKQQARTDDRESKGSALVAQLTRQMHAPVSDKKGNGSKAASEVAQGGEASGSDDGHSVVHARKNTDTQLAGAA